MKKSLINKLFSILKKNFYFFYIMKDDNNFYFTNHKFFIFLNDNILNFPDGCKNKTLYKYEYKKIIESDETDKMNIKKIKSFLEKVNRQMPVNRNDYINNTCEFEFVLKVLFEKGLLLSSKYYNFFIEMYKNNFMYKIFILNNNQIYIQFLNGNLFMVISLMEKIENDV